MSAADAENGLAAYGFEEMAWSFVVMVVFWVALFGILCLTETRWAGSLPQSGKAHENNKYWTSRHAFAFLHSILISVITVPSLCVFLLIDAPPEVKFGYARDLGTCRIPEELFDDYHEYDLMIRAVAFAGLAFTAWVLADIVISFATRQATFDHIAHHVVFMLAGFIIRGHCILGLNACVLMSMEISTPFLNYMLFFRHRGDGYKKAVQTTGVVFVVLFVIFRLVVNTWGTVVLWLRRDLALTGVVPAWQEWFLLFAVTAGAAVQFFWFPAIARAFGAGIVSLFTSGRGSSTLAPPREAAAEESAARSARGAVALHEAAQSDLRGGGANAA